MDARAGNSSDSNAVPWVQTSFLLRPLPARTDFRGALPSPGVAHRSSFHLLSASNVPCKSLNYNNKICRRRWQSSSTSACKFIRTNRRWGWMEQPREIGSQAAYGNPRSVSRAAS